MEKKWIVFQLLCALEQIHGAKVANIINHYLSFKIISICNLNYNFTWPFAQEPLKNRLRTPQEPRIYEMVYLRKGLKVTVSIALPLPPGIVSLGLISSPSGAVISAKVYSYYNLDFL